MRDTVTPGVSPDCPCAQPVFPAFPPLLSQSVAHSLLDTATWKDIPDPRQRYLLGLHGVNYGSLLGVLVDEEVHVVVSEGWQDFHLHVDLSHCLGLPQLVLCVQEFSSQLCWTWAPKNSQNSAVGGGQVGQGMAGPPAHRKTVQPCGLLCPSDKRSEATTRQSLVPLRALGAPQLPREGTGHFALHAGKTLYLDQGGDFKGQESRMVLAKGQPGTVTLQEKHKGHVTAEKQKGRRAKKGEIQKYTHCSNRNIRFLIWGNILHSTGREARLSKGARLPTWPGKRHTQGSCSCLP